MGRSTILYKYKLLTFIKTYPSVNKWYNMSLICFFRDRPLFFLLKATRTFYVTVKTALKHPSFSSLITLNNISRIPFLACSTCYVRLYMSISICLGFIWLKYSFPLLIRPSNVLISPIETGNAILLENRRFLTGNASRKASILKSCSDVMIAEIKV